mmetsp:Transcript_4530/g.6785  ORF Transcript_4530/g.6785 Transcript_4530/m.6785 type:complete len:283 (+) Transcript_4530:616-1464(+)
MRTSGRVMKNARTSGRVTAHISMGRQPAPSGGLSCTGCAASPSSSASCFLTRNSIERSYQAMNSSCSMYPSLLVSMSLKAACSSPSSTFLFKVSRMLLSSCISIRSSELLSKKLKISWASFLMRSSLATYQFLNSSNSTTPSLLVSSFAMHEATSASLGSALLIFWRRRRISSLSIVPLPSLSRASKVSFKPPAMRLTTATPAVVKMLWRCVSKWRMPARKVEGRRKRLLLNSRDRVPPRSPWAHPPICWPDLLPPTNLISSSRPRWADEGLAGVLLWDCCA